MNDRFMRCLKETFRHEGDFVNDPHDSGGATKYGITIHTLRRWRGQDVTEADVRALTKDEATRIYFSFYWNRVRGDDLPPGLDFAVFDFAVHAGVRRASEFLQRILGVTVDGIIGQETVAAAQAADVPSVIRQLCANRLAFLQRLRNWERYRNGWTRRVREVEQVSLRWYDEFNTLRTASKTEAVRVTAVTGSVLASASAVLHEIVPVMEQVQPLLRYGYYGAMVLVAVLIVAGVVWWKKGKVS